MGVSKLRPRNFKLQTSDLETSDPLKNDWNYMNEYLFMKIIMTNPSVKSRNNPALIIADR